MRQNLNPSCIVKHIVGYVYSTLLCTLASLDFPSWRTVLTEGWLGFFYQQSIRLALLELQFYSLGLALIQATNLITKKELLTTDPDTEDKQLIYEITTGPRNGHVENKLKPGTAVTTFTQGMELGCVLLLFAISWFSLLK